MTPGATYQAVLDLLVLYERDTRPVDVTIAAYMKERRYIGSRDRRDVTSIVYEVIRHWALIHWKTELGGQSPHVISGLTGARIRLITYLTLVKEFPQSHIAVIFNGQLYHPLPLEQSEKRLIASFEKTPPIDEAPLWVKGECPQWLWPLLQQHYGEETPALLASLNKEATFDVRVNTLKTERRALIDLLKEEEGQVATPTPLSPVGLRFDDRLPVGSWEIFQAGYFDVQDEGSQLAALMVEALPGQFILDLCAGAGGKTLAMAADMQNKGRMLATDTYKWRLNRAGERLRRAGVHNVECKALDEGEGLPKWLKRQKGHFDRVLVDAPCSGTGTWRRNPDAKWRLSAQELTSLQGIQQDILMRAAPLVRLRGRLIYVTCSLLKEENEQQVEKFLAMQPDFTLLPCEDIWRRIADAPYPAQGSYLNLRPDIHGTDGFFVAVLQKTT